MYCSNCGAKIGEKAVVCIKCGCPAPKKPETVVSQGTVQTVQNTQAPMQVQQQGNGAATASLVLGIVSVVAGVISFFISFCYYVYAVETYSPSYNYNYNYNYDYYETSNVGENLIAAIMIVFIPAVLSIVGLLLGIFCKTNPGKGAKITGIVLNIITVVLCILQVLMIMSV